ncbi:unnamed protein product [Trichobilharzia szidati]|nr:unnamed protein product [Trichobilharzia szidati]
MYQFRSLQKQIKILEANEAVLDKRLSRIEQNHYHKQQNRASSYPHRHKGLLRSSGESGLHEVTSLRNESRCNYKFATHNHLLDTNLLIKQFHNHQRSLNRENLFTKRKKRSYHRYSGSVLTRRNVLDLTGQNRSKFCECQSTKCWNSDSGNSFPQEYLGIQCSLGSCTPPRCELRAEPDESSISEADNYVNETFVSTDKPRIYEMNDSNEEDAYIALEIISSVSKSSQLDKQSVNNLQISPTLSNKIPLRPLTPTVSEDTCLADSNDQNYSTTVNDISNLVSADSLSTSQIYDHKADAVKVDGDADDEVSCAKSTLKIQDDKMSTEEKVEELKRPKIMPRKSFLIPLNNYETNSTILLKTNTHEHIEIFKHIINELIQTERNYCHTLRVLIDTLAKIIQAKCGLCKEDLSQLFPNSLLNMYKMHNQILIHMERDLHSVKNSITFNSVNILLKVLCGVDFEDCCELNNRLNDLLLNELQLNSSPFYEIYKNYLLEFTVTMKTMRKLLHQSTRFRQIVKRLQNNECGGTELSTLLIAPIQRIPRYLLLIKQFIRQINKIEGSISVERNFEQENVYSQTVSLITSRLKNSQLSNHFSEFIHKTRGTNQAIIIEPMKNETTDNTIKVNRCNPLTLGKSNTHYVKCKKAWFHVRRAFSEKRGEEGERKDCQFPKNLSSLRISRRSPPKLLDDKSKVKRMSSKDDSVDVKINKLTEKNNNLGHNMGNTSQNHVSKEEKYEDYSNQRCKSLSKQSGLPVEVKETEMSKRIQKVCLLNVPPCVGQRRSINKISKLRTNEKHDTKETELLTNINLNSSTSSYSKNQPGVRNSSLQVSLGENQSQQSSKQFDRISFDSKVTCNPSPRSNIPSLSSGIPRRHSDPLCLSKAENNNQKPMSLIYSTADNQIKSVSEPPCHKESIQSVHNDLVHKKLNQSEETFTGCREHVDGLQLQPNGKQIHKTNKDEPKSLTEGNMLLHHCSQVSESKPTSGNSEDYTASLSFRSEEDKSMRTNHVWKIPLFKYIRRLTNPTSSRRNDPVVVATNTSGLNKPVLNDKSEQLVNLPNEKITNHQISFESHLSEPLSHPNKVKTPVSVNNISETKSSYQLSSVNDEQIEIIQVECTLKETILENKFNRYFDAGGEGSQKKNIPILTEESNFEGENCGNLLKYESYNDSVFLDETGNLCFTA